MPELDLQTAARAWPVAIPPPGALAPAVIATWRARMIHEHASSHVFESLAAQLSAIGEAEAAATCVAFAAEERRHGAQCGAVVAAAGGDAVAQVGGPQSVPAHPDTTPRAAVARNVLAIACLAETVAVALIGAERLEMPDGPLREHLTRIWADEIGHARFGWLYLARVLPTLTDEERDAVARYLPLALGELERHELAHLPLDRAWPAEGATFGLCDGGDARTLFFETVADVIIPQLAGLGLPADTAWTHRRTV